MENPHFLERAFALADSGDIRTIAELRWALLREEYAYSEVAQLSGLVLSRQLHARMKAAAARPSGA